MTRQLRNPATAALPRSRTHGTAKPSHHADNLSPEPFPVLPVGARKASPSLAVSAPNRPPEDNPLQNRRYPGAGRRPRRRDPSRPVRCSRRCDVSTLPAKWNHCAATGQRLKVDRRCRRVLTTDVRVEHVPTSPNRSCRCPPSRRPTPSFQFPHSIAGQMGRHAKVSRRSEDNSIVLLQP